MSTRIHIDSTRFENGFFEAGGSEHGDWTKNLDAIRFEGGGLGLPISSIFENVFRLTVDPWFKPVTWEYYGFEEHPDWYITPTSVYLDTGDAEYVSDWSRMALVSPIPLPASGWLLLLGPAALAGVKRFASRRRRTTAPPDLSVMAGKVATAR